MNGSIEYIRLNFNTSHGGDFSAGGRRQHFISNLPICQTVADILEKEQNCSPTAHTIFKTPKETLDGFLKERFGGLELFEFMKIYSKLHIGQEFLLPVPDSIICMFYEATDVEALKSQINSNENILTQNLNDGPLNLHVDSIATFTLVKASDVDLSKLLGGYQYSYGNFNFFIKSSMQFDLTVVYEEKKQGV